MASDREMAKKEIESIELGSFLDARLFVTGEDLATIVGHFSESPDFICVRPDGTVVGIELTKVTADREIASWDRMRYGEVRIDAYRTLETIHHLVNRKEKTRRERYSKHVDDCILVLQLVDGSLRQIAWAFEGLEEDYRSHGFEEIWLADYSGIEAYGDVELFGLYPQTRWGYHSRPAADRKPYG